MAAQFDLYRMGDGTLVTVLQSDLLDGLQTRVVAPLIPADQIGRVMAPLNPSVQVGAERFLLMPQLAATLTVAELGERVGSLAVMRDEIVRALDALLSGV
ncbi:CcdB family protein [Salipiger sp. P9]|uniref:CcdB family protein n=1 Tax=Salipiger pentaromativorans TaxID=2943193 RepID=UPI0021585E06|nr:CcdB family protein [Salipiger pentaromativorans]MCR8548378.1 CcdB family protein [Salipiger pentaromativorans]